MADLREKSFAPTEYRNTVGGGHMATDPKKRPGATPASVFGKTETPVTVKRVGLRARDLLVGASAEDDLPPRLIIESFEGVDVPFDRLEWRDRTLRLVRRRLGGVNEPAA